MGRQGDKETRGQGVKGSKRVSIPLLRLVSVSPFPLLSALFALLILLSYNAPIYCIAEYERQIMTQRAGIALEEILNTEEFREQIPQPPWWHRLAERFFNYLPGGTGWMGSVLEWLLYFIGILVIASVFVFIARRFRRLPSLKIDHDSAVEPQRYADPGAVKTQAYEYFQRDDYRQAIRYLYLSLLLYLDRAGLLTYDKGKTNSEYLGEVHSSMGDEAERFADLTLSFERKWYGMEKSSAADFQQCEQAFIELVGS